MIQTNLKIQATAESFMSSEDDLTRAFQNKLTLDIVNTDESPDRLLLNPDGSPDRLLLNTELQEDEVDVFWKSEVVSELLSEIDMKRWFETVRGLTGFNRFSPGPGILDAKEWIVKAMMEIPGLSVTTQEFIKWGQPLYNVIGTIPGSENPENVVVVGAHYDSISEKPNLAAPGAVDNATGSAAVLEMARLFAKRPPKVTVVFILYAGEEQGYYGSSAHMREFSGKPFDIKMMLNIDMIGWDNPDGNYLEIETQPQYLNLAEFFRTSAEKFCSAPTKISLHAWGSDHMSYLDLQIPSVLTTNKDCVEYPCYHTTRDTLDKVSIDVSEHFLRMDVPVLAQLLYNGVDPRNFAQKYG